MLKYKEEELNEEKADIFLRDTFYYKNAVCVRFRDILKENFS